MERRKHTDEFRAKVLSEIAGGETLPAVAKKYSLSQGMIYNWRNKAMGKKRKSSKKKPKVVKQKLVPVANKKFVAGNPGARTAIIILKQYMDEVNNAFGSGRKMTTQDARVIMALDALENVK